VLLHQFQRFLAPLAGELDRLFADADDAVVDLAGFAAVAVPFDDLLELESQVGEA
jgi:hypothetical protein